MKKLMRATSLASVSLALSLSGVSALSSANAASMRHTLNCYLADATQFNAMVSAKAKVVKGTTCPAKYTPNKFVSVAGNQLNIADQQGFYQLFWATGIQAGIVNPATLGFKVHFDELLGPSIVSSVISGSDDITPVVSPAIWAESLDAGQKLTAVAVNQLVNPQNYWQVVVSPAGYQGGLTTPANLAGKKIAYVAGQDSQYVLDRLLASNNVAVNNYTFENLPESSDLAALFGGSVDAIVASPITAAEAVAQGGKVIGNGAGILSGYDPILMTPASVHNAAKMAMVAKYLYVSAQIDHWILTHQAAFTTIIFNTFFAVQPSLNNPVGQALAAVLYQTGVNTFIPFTPAVTKEMGQEAIQLRVDGVLQKTPNLAASIDYSLTPELKVLAHVASGH